MPFLRDEVGADNQTIIVDHSSGAVAAMRFAEQYKILGSVLVGACYTALGIENERLSVYYSRPWNWQQIKANQKWICLFASQDDPWIPVKGSRFIHQQLDCEYHEFKNQGHFGGDYFKEVFPEITLSILNFINSHKNIA